MTDRFTLLIQGRARCQLIKAKGEPGYFHSIRVEPRYRRRGFGLELIKFALQYTREFLEMDIRYQSKVAQRHAARLGYRKIGTSERYAGCELWRHYNQKSKLPTSKLQLLKAMRFKRTDGKTVVLYLSSSVD
jgi:GNAT superfamily N-acetyltransferase